jgi:hypothetical protein
MPEFAICSAIAIGVLLERELKDIGIGVSHFAITNF